MVFGGLDMILKIGNCNGLRDHLTCAVYNKITSTQLVRLNRGVWLHEANVVSSGQFATFATKPEQQCGEHQQTINALLAAMGTPPRRGILPGRADTQLGVAGLRPRRATNPPGGSP